MFRALALFAVLVVGACAAQNNSTPTIAAVAPTVSGTETARGSFVGASNHETTGNASVVRQADGNWIVVLDDDFTLDGAPDPVVGFGSNGYVEEAQLAPLQALAGRQVYRVPASLRVADFNEVYIWCGQFSVPLGVASLDLT